MCYGARCLRASLVACLNVNKQAGAAATSFPGQNMGLLALALMVAGGKDNAPHLVQQLHSQHSIMQQRLPVCFTYWSESVPGLVARATSLAHAATL
jgi:hypothetical protein